MAEILISLFLSSLIMAILGQLYLHVKKDYMHIQTQLDRHFNILWVKDLLYDSIRQSGFTPCLGIEHLKTVESIPTLTYSNQSQWITTHRMNEYYTNPIHILSSGTIRIPSQFILDENRPLIIADCFHAEIHTIARVDHSHSEQIITLMKPLQFNYSSLSYIGEWLEETWFIKKNPSGKPALYYKFKETEELTPLIQSLHLTEQLINAKRLIKVQFNTALDKISPLYVAGLNS